MEENLISLGLKIKKDPLTYKKEYLMQIKAFSALIDLPSPPIKQIKPMIFFIVQHCKLDPTTSVRALVAALECLKDVRTKKIILNGLVILRQKKHIESKELIRFIILHGNDLRYFLRSTQEFLNLECYGILVEWYKKGTERQKCFCYFLLTVLFSKIHDVYERKKMQAAAQVKCENLISSEEDDYSSEIEVESESEHSSEPLKGEDILENSSDDSMENDNTKNSRFSNIKDEGRFDNSLNMVDLEELEEIITSAFFGISKITKICCLYFLNRTEIKFDITKLKNGEEHAKKLFKELSDEVIDRDIKKMKIKIFILFKEHFRIRKSIVKIIVSMIDLENEDLRDLLDYIVASVGLSEVKDVLKMVSEEFVREGQCEEVIAYGMNVMREIYYKFKCLIYDSNDDFEKNESFLEEIKVLILQYIECFRGNKTKSIFYAYKMIIKVLVKGEEVNAPVNHVKKKATKEEMTIMRNRGKEEVKRLRMESKRKEKQELYKKKRKGRSKTAMLKFMLKPNKKKGKKRG